MHEPLLVPPLHSEFSSLGDTISIPLVRRIHCEAEGLRNHLAHLVTFPGRYGHIPQHWASQINEFNKEYLNPYLNYHRPCFFPEIYTAASGKEKRRYPYKKMMTPFEKFQSLPESKSYLNSWTTWDQLVSRAYAQTDNQAAEALAEARDKVLEEIHSDDERCVSSGK